MVLLGFGRERLADPKQRCHIVKVRRVSRKAFGGKTFGSREQQLGVSETSVSRMVAADAIAMVEADPP